MDCPEESCRGYWYVAEVINRDLGWTQRKCQKAVEEIFGEEMEILKRVTSNLED